MIDAMLSSPGEVYPPPAGWYDYPLATLRRRAADMLVPAVVQAIEKAWEVELPAKRFPHCRRLAGAGVRAALGPLSTTTLGPAGYLCTPFSPVWMLPSYWEPATARGEDRLAPLELVAYRWAAAIVGMEVRNRLENLHAKYTTDVGMPTLNRGVRNAVLAVLVQDRVIGYLLSQNLAGFVHLADCLAQSGVRIPAAAGRP